MENLEKFRKQLPTTEHGDDWTIWGKFGKFGKVWEHLEKQNTHLGNKMNKMKEKLYNLEKNRKIKDI